MHENEIPYGVRDCIFKVYNNLGPGLLESAYEAALKLELQKKNLSVSAQVPLPLLYDTVLVNVGYRIDLLVENKVILALR